MTPTRLHDILQTLRWSARDLAEEANVAERTIRRWLSGAYPVPDAVADALERRVGCVVAHPIPQRERAR